MENNNFKQTYHNQQLTSEIKRKHNEQRKIGKFCDFTLKTEDGGEFKVHKNVIVTASTYFEKKFNSENNFNSMVMRRCTSNVLEKIIEYMYTGEIEITTENVREVLGTAYFLELMSLVDTCTNFLVQIVNTANCFKLLIYSETYSTSDALKEKCVKTICENFETLKNSTEFRELLTIDTMLQLCSCDRSLCNDEQLFLAILDWIEYDKENRQKFIPLLLDEIRFEEMSLEFGISNILANDLLGENRDYISKVNDVIRRNWMEQLKRNKNQKIIPNSEVPNLYAVIGDKVLSYEPGLKPFTTMVTRICTNHIGCGYSTFGDKNLFICGGSFGVNYTNLCAYYSFNENSWKSLPPMKVARFGHRSIRLDNKIYVCGGFEEDTVEVFDINTTKWNGGPSLDRDRVFIGLCLHNRNIYAAHGLSLQLLDTRLDEWFELPSLRSKTSKGICFAITYNDLIYGIAREGIFTFDINANRWSRSFKSYGGAYSANNPVACLIGNEIYIFARFGGDQRNTYKLQSYNASDLSKCDVHLIELPSTDQNCWDLFSL